MQDRQNVKNGQINLSKCQAWLLQISIEIILIYGVFILLKKCPNRDKLFIRLCFSAISKFSVIFWHKIISSQCTNWQFTFLSGAIPHAYTLLAYDFYKQTDNISVLEYIHHKWTFHVKGLWYYPPNEPLPSFTLIGSPNFGHGSVYQDLEAQVAIVTVDQELSYTLHEEKTQLHSRVQEVTCETFEWREHKLPV